MFDQARVRAKKVLEAKQMSWRLGTARRCFSYECNALQRAYVQHSQTFCTMYCSHEATATKHLRKYIQVMSMSTCIILFSVGCMLIHIWDCGGGLCMGMPSCLRFHTNCCCSPFPCNSPPPPKKDSTKYITFFEGGYMERTKCQDVTR